MSLVFKPRPNTIAGHYTFTEWGRWWDGSPEPANISGRQCTLQYMHYRVEYLDVNTTREWLWSHYRTILPKQSTTEQTIYLVFPFQGAEHEAKTGFWMIPSGSMFTSVRMGSFLKQ